MNRVPSFRKIILLFSLAALIIAVGVLTVSAETEPHETYAVESFVTESAETTSPIESTVPSEPEETASSTETTDSSTATTAPEHTYRESLPEISSEEIIIPKPVVNAKEEEPPLFWGFVAWICIGVGVAVVLAVLLTTKTRAMRSGGKKRYSTGDKISGKKRLLNDKYYNDQRRR